MSELYGKMSEEWQVMTVRRRIREWWAVQNKDGQALVEYALILALVAVVVVVALSGLGSSIANLFNNVTTNLAK
jgi:pilus assembly protein Flp/PilA